MKDFLKAGFRVSQSEKISDQVMVIRLGIMVTVMVICLAAMGLSAYAYFSHSISSGNNRIQTGSFGTTVEVTGETPNEDVYLLRSGMAYNITMTKTGNASTGFCILEITIGEHTVKYFTEQLGVGGNEPAETVSFVLDLSGVSQVETVKLVVKAHLGTSCLYGYEVSDGNGGYIAEGATVTVMDLTEEKSEEETPEASKPGEEEKPEADSETTPTEPELIRYTIQSGDTLSALAIRFGVSVARIAAYNNIADPNKIQVGWVITIPPEDWTMDP